MPASGNRKRPFGLYAITGLLLVNAILIALDESRSYVGIGVSLGVPIPSVPGIHDADIDRVVRYVAAAAYLAAAIGIWAFRRWAWAALMIVVGISLADGIVRYTREQPEYLTMLLNLLIVFYLNQRDVQLLFQGGRGDAAPTSA